MTDPISQARVHPDYTPEVLRWRAVLRPWLTVNGQIAAERPLESMSGEILAQSAVNIIPDGLRRKAELCVDHCASGFHDHRQAAPPVFLTAAEEKFFTDDEHKTIKALKEEFATILPTLLEQAKAKEHAAALQRCKKHADYVVCLRRLRGDIATSVPNPGADIATS